MVLNKALKKMIITVTELKKSPAKYFKMAETEEVIIFRANKGKDIKLTPVNK